MFTVASEDGDENGLFTVPEFDGMSQYYASRES
jgi:hypothetical protein